MLLWDLNLQIESLKKIKHGLQYLVQMFVLMIMKLENLFLIIIVFVVQYNELCFATAVQKFQEENNKKLLANKV